MAGELSGRVALIAGGGGEIGGAIARRFAEAGAAIAIADIEREAAEVVAGEITAAGGQAVAVRTNVAVEQDAERAVRHAVEAFGKLTTLVNVAATVTPDGTVETLTLDDWNDALAVNLTGAFLMCKYAVPQLRKAGGGTIINIASQLGQIGIANRAPYTTSKAGADPAHAHASRSITPPTASAPIRCRPAASTPRASCAASRTARRPTAPAARPICSAVPAAPRKSRLRHYSSRRRKSSFMTGADLLLDGGYLAFKGPLPAKDKLERTTCRSGGFPHSPRSASRPRRHPRSPSPTSTAARPSPSW